MVRRPVFTGRHTVFHGFGRRGIETPPGMQPTTWWGSPTLTLPYGVQETNVRLQAEDGAHSSGILYRRGGERTAIVFNHPRADFSSHYLVPAMLAGGFAAYGGQTRYLGNDINCEHECLCADLAAQIRYLRAAGLREGRALRQQRRRSALDFLSVAGDDPAAASPDRHGGRQSL